MYMYMHLKKTYMHDIDAHYLIHIYQYQEMRAHEQTNMQHLVPIKAALPHAV